MSAPARIALVVDDDRITRMVHCSHLKALGFQTQEAEDGKDAVQLLEEGNKFQLILMDCEMTSMHGPEATRRIREMGIETPILGVSSISDETLRANFVGSGLTDLFTKPLARDMLMPYARVG
ncbi:hypothetical protein C5167_047841 [Papaver somniferum]|uniref:Response regulatory domain-containing protein n=1 Tax=Papaver somniferum TaxID=3469 RepID=A0A4Y7LKN6_PAPSO|nr:two-component response regulator 24-like [Papaver somniferum]RZC85058.1 hypothetical protein C5167_047841 [Papaver somniferum]